MPRYSILPTALALPFLTLAHPATSADTYQSAYVQNSLVHSILPANKQHEHPLIFVPGRNLSSYIFTTTPDSRPGWAQIFAAAGFKVHIINDPDFDFATGGFSVSPFTVPTGGPAADPTSELAWQRPVWNRWGFGPSEGTAYPDARFPTAHFATFAANYPYVGDSADSYSGNIVALLDSTGPAYLVVHSAGATSAVLAAKDRPHLVKGFIFVEPAGPPDGDDFPNLAGMSMLGVYGDYIAERNQTTRKTETEAAATLFQQHGGCNHVISLPDDYNIFGNSHLMMQDDNSHFIASLIIDWLTNVAHTPPHNFASSYVGDALVHSILPHNGRHKVPIIMVPGLNLSSYIFTTTPDGRPGWAQIFAEDGFDVHVINDPDFDFATGGVSVTPFTVPTGGPAADPTSAQGWQQDIWRRWGFGDPQGTPYPDTRFPTDDFAAFAANYPYLSSSTQNYDDAIVDLLAQTGPAILMAHSAGGPQALNAALERPDLVLGFIFIEPTGPPEANDFPALAGMSMFGVYGDYIASRNQTNRKAATEAAALLFAQNGGAGEVVSLPDDLAINGNTHLMMQDNNSEFIADLIIDWLNANMNTACSPTQISLHKFGNKTILKSPVEGIWQSTTDFLSWTPLSVESTRQLTVTSPTPRAFFRQVD
ncbi:MAG: alpha/beta fold hydrolase [Verrucomicrobiota bacterium]